MLNPVFGTPNSESSWARHDYLDECLYLYLEHVPGGSITQVRLPAVGSSNCSVLLMFAVKKLSSHKHGSCRIQYLNSGLSKDTVHQSSSHIGKYHSNTSWEVRDCKVMCRDFGRVHLKCASFDWRGAEWLRTLGRRPHGVVRAPNLSHSAALNINSGRWDVIWVEQQKILRKDQSKLHEDVKSWDTQTFSTEFNSPSFAARLTARLNLGFVSSARDDFRGWKLKDVIHFSRSGSSHCQEGLEYLHTREPAVIHRDIKGSNILIGDGAWVEICRKRHLSSLHWWHQWHQPFDFDAYNLTHSSLAGDTVKLADFGCSKRTDETLTCLGFTEQALRRRFCPWDLSLNFAHMVCAKFHGSTAFAPSIHPLQFSLLPICLSRHTMRGSIPWMAPEVVLRCDTNMDCSRCVYFFLRIGE